MTEWGIFNDEGCIESGLFSAAEAESAAARYRERYDRDEDDGDPHAEALEMCSDHEEQPRDFCEECSGEEE